MRTLSKSKLLAYRQCPKRLWLEVHAPHHRADSESTQASFAVGHQVGDIVRQLYDPQGEGALIDPQVEGFDAAFARTQELLKSSQPIFEAGFRVKGALAFADVMLPDTQLGQSGWRMIEVKSSTSVKDYHRDDVAVQTWIARAAGVPLTQVALSHIDSTWVYPGDGNYMGLMHENDLTQEAMSRDAEVRTWMKEAQEIVALHSEPSVSTGKHCQQPYACGFLDYCQREAPHAEQPIRWLPGRLGQELQAHIETNNLVELADVPHELLSEKQQRVKSVTLSGKPYFDQQGAREALAPHPLPAYFMDFETIQFAVPIWAGTRPYQLIPFQFSVHFLSDTKTLDHHEFIDLSGKDPSRAFAEALIACCGESGPIFVYNAEFETSRIRELSERYPDLSEALLALNDRVVDLLPIARNFYYHPSQQGSWSIKAVLPALCPDLNYDQLPGVQNGGMAMNAFLEAIAHSTSSLRRDEINQHLLAYCRLDTYAMVRLWAAFIGLDLKV